MLNYVFVFLLLALIAALMGFGVLTGQFAQTAQLFAMLFTIVCIATFIYDLITRKRTQPPV